MDNDERIRLILDVTGSASIDEANAKLATMSTETKAVDISMKGLGQTMHPSGDFGRGILQGSYAIQDFTSQIGTRGLAGALGAIQNNIPGILAGFGAGAGLAGVISVVSVGAGLLYENWDKVTSAFGKTTEKLPALKEGLEGLKDTLKEVDDKIEALEKKAKGGALDFFDNEKLEKLRALKEEGEERQAAEKLVGGIGAFDSEEARTRRSAVGKAIAEAGGGNRVAENLAMNTGMSADEATAVVAGAMRGNLTDLETLQKNAPTFGKQYDEVSPETAAAGDQAVAEAEEFGDRAHRGAAKFRRAKQQQIDQDKLAEQLTERGRDAERRTFEERDRDRDHDATKREHEAERIRKKREHDAQHNSPQEVNRREADAEQNRYLGAVMANTQGLTPDQQQMVAKHLQGNHEAGLDMSASFEQALAYAIRQTRVQIAQGIQAGLHRQQMQGESRMSP